MTRPSPSPDREPVSPRFALKAATAEAHERLDARFSGLDLAERDDYSAFLLAQAGAFLPIEAALDQAGVKSVIPDWRARRRAAALLADLAALGLEPPAPVAAPPLSSAADILGAAYVLEGSRLGGTILVRAVPDALAKTFLQPGEPFGLARICDGSGRTAKLTGRHRRRRQDGERGVRSLLVLGVDDSGTART